MRRYIGLCASIMWLSACGGTSAVGLSTRVGAPRGASAVPGQAEQRLEVANGITVERVRLSVEKLELEREGVDDDSDDSDDSSEAGTSDDAGDDSQELETGPFLIDLSGEALEGQVVRLRDVQVEPGWYDEIEFKIERLSVESAGDDAGLKELAERGASVIIDGRIDGVPFSFTSALEVEQEREARFEVKADDAQNVTININPGSWFTGSSGQRLDPRDSGARSAIESNIKNSIDAFDDDDHDGGEDHDDDDDDSGDDDED